MPLRDSIRDELYGSDADSVADEVASSAYDEILESASYPHSAFKILAIAVAAEIGLIAMFFVAGDKVQGFLYDENFLYLALALFAVGFLIAFTTACSNTLGARVGGPTQRHQASSLARRPDLTPTVCGSGSSRLPPESRT